MRAMRIYFAGSISGGREDVQLYAEIITLLGEFGTVVTEHVGDRSLTAETGEDLEPRLIHDRDLQWLRSADALVAEVSTPSLGVGYEIAYGVQLRKRVLCLYRPAQGRRLSAMVAGCPGLRLIEYGDAEELRTAIKHFFSGE
jgi:hypothetical protein